MDRSTKCRAFTLVEIMIAILIIGILLGIAIPNYVTAREQSRKKSCVENLRRVDYAKDAYLMDKNLPGSTPSSAFTDTVLYGTGGYLSAKPQCPGGGSYTPNNGDQLPTCDYRGGGVHVYDGS